MLFKVFSVLALFCLTTMSFYGQVYSAKITDKEIIDFLNWKLSKEKKYSEEPKSGPKKIYTVISKLDTATFFPERKKNSVSLSSKIYLFYPRNNWLDTIFTKEDKEFLYQQFTLQIDTNWRHKFAKAKLIKSLKQRRPNYYRFSIPLFSIDRKFVIIKEVYYCGKLCAYGGFKIYRRKDDKNWEYIGAVNNWIS